METEARSLSHFLCPFIPQSTWSLACDPQWLL